MKKYISLIICILLLPCLFMACENEERKNILPPVSFVQRLLEDGTIDTENMRFTLVGEVKANEEIGGNASLKFEYCNGYGRKARIAVTSAANIIKGSATVDLHGGSDTASVAVPLYGAPKDMGNIEVCVSILAEGTAPVNLRANLVVADPVELYRVDFDNIVCEGEIYDNIEGSTLLKIPYTKGYGRSATVKVESEVGLSGKEVRKLNGDYASLSEGEAGVMEIPIFGIPNENGEVDLTITVSSAGGMSVVGKARITILENTDVFPELQLLPEVQLSGALYRNALIGELSNAKLIVPYKNGYGRNITVRVNEVNGISAEEKSYKLQGGAVEGTFEMLLQGTPLLAGENELTISVITEEGLELSQKVIVVVDYPAELIINGCTVQGEYYANIVLGTDACIEVSYENGYQRNVKCTAVLDGTASGITCNIPVNPIVLADNTGTFTIPLIGTKPVAGTFPFMLIFEPENESMKTVSGIIMVSGEKPIEFDFDDILFDGNPVVLNEFVSITLRIPFANGSGTFDAEVSGALTGSVSDVTLSSTTGYLEIPVSGTPNRELGSMSIKITNVEKKTVYTQEVPFYAGTRIHYNGIDYYSVFVDVDKNGKIGAGEIWLDRNIGATSNEPGIFEPNGANMDCVGHYYQYGKSYGENANVLDETTGWCDYDAEWINPIGDWNICPEGYRLPTVKEWEAICTRIAEINTFLGISNTQQHMMDSALKLPLGGWMNNSFAKGTWAQGKMGCYWTSDRFGDNDVIAFQLQQNGAYKAMRWSGKSNQARLQVRCVKQY